MAAALQRLGGTDFTRIAAIVVRGERGVKELRDTRRTSNGTFRAPLVPHVSYWPAGFTRTLR